MYRLQERYPRLAHLLDGLGTLLLSNLVWILASLPLVTLPAATAGLFAVTAPYSRGLTSDFPAGFFSTMRRLWLRSTFAFGLDLAIAGLIYLDLQLVAVMRMPLGWLTWIVAVLVGAVVLLANLYLWPLLVTFRMPLRRVVSTSVRLTLGHLPWSLFLAAASALPIALALYVPIIMVLGSFSAASLLVNWGAWRVIRRYVDAEELANLLPPPG